MHHMILKISINVDSVLNLPACMVIATVLLDLNFTYAHEQKATARNIHGNAPK